MKITRKYIVLPVTSLLGISFIFLILFVLNDKLLNIYTFVAVPVVCTIASIITYKIVTTKYIELIAKAKTWMIIFIYLNVYLGMAIGIMVGVLFSWLLLYPFSLLFGNPEQISWSASKSLAFELLVILSTFLTTALSIKYFFNTGIHYLKKKVNSVK
jgi:hypothetical protein